MSDLTIGAVASRQRPGIIQRFDSLLHAVWLMHTRARERRLLAELGARELRDIGLTPHEAGIEARKPFWQA